MTKKKLKIAVAMSGGVDSSVSAFLLKERGYDVTGFFMKLWSDSGCRSEQEKESLEKAQKVATELGIPFQVLDAEEIFKTSVVDNFISEYEKLNTPNPCVGCNKAIKFGWLLEKFKSLGFDKLATGHYCQIKKDKNGTYHLLSGKDELKDQSYFLFRLDQTQLSRIMFPVGNFDKSEVYQMAKERELQFEDKKESQEICFIQNEDYREFLKKHLDNDNFLSGDIVDATGKVLGQHQGLINYTIGQRKGIEQLGVKDENRKPSYVIGFDKKKNQLIVGADEEVYAKEMNLKEMSWSFSEARKLALASDKLKVKIRYRHQAVLCNLMTDKKSKSIFRVIFKKPQRAITPGQFAVFYLGKEVLGGGVIRK